MSEIYHEAYREGWKDAERDAEERHRNEVTVNRADLTYALTIVRTAAPGYFQQVERTDYEEHNRITRLRDAVGETA